MNGVTPTVRFRRSSALTVAAVIVMIAGASLATWAPILLVFLVIPLAVAVWSWRSGTDVTSDGLTVRAAVGSRRIPWSDVDGLMTDAGGQVNARLHSGHAVPLPAVRAADLPRVVSAAGQELHKP